MSCKAGYAVSMVAKTPTLPQWFIESTISELSSCINIHECDEEEFEQASPLFTYTVPKTVDIRGYREGRPYKVFTGPKFSEISNESSP